MKEITVLFFATLRDHMGEKMMTLKLPKNADVQDLKTRLAVQKPGTQAVLDAALVSINREYAYTDEIIPDGAEVAFFPHVSGG
jgi:molybdopterin converting factor subunit 1